MIPLSAGPCLPGASGCEAESFPLSNSPGANGIPVCFPCYLGAMGSLSNSRGALGSLPPTAQTELNYHPGGECSRSWGVLYGAKRPPRAAQESSRALQTPSKGLQEPPRTVIKPPSGLKKTLRGLQEPIEPSWTPPRT